MQLDLISKKQTKLFPKLTHGSSPSKKGKRKVKRPLIEGCVTHVVFKSSKAKGKLSFYKNKNLVKALLKERSKKFYVEVLDFVNMGNHLHLKVRFKSADRFRNFLRTFSSLLARRITFASKSNPFGKFWDGLVFTRVLTSRFEEFGLKAYFEANRIERNQGYQARENYLANFNLRFRNVDP